jgi:2-dehydro-3-deoxyglucarate aldolase/4-hydroxy-2-oxoheptanedioate aldolase
MVRVMSIGGFPDPKLVEMIGCHCEVHGIWIDQEHSYVSHAAMELLLMACRAGGLDAFARVPLTDYAALARPYETGCSGVMVAQIRRPDEVHRALHWATYPPRGMRGLFVSNAECQWGKVSAAEQMECAARERWLAIQIETLEALDCLDDLAAIEGVQMLFVGPADLSSALGVPGQVLHEKCREALRAVAAACQKAGKPWGTLSRSTEHAEYCRELGCQLFSIASDVDLIVRGMETTRAMFASLGND